MQTVKEQWNCWCCFKLLNRDMKDETTRKVINFPSRWRAETSKKGMLFKLGSLLLGLLLPLLLLLLLLLFLPKKELVLVLSTAFRKHLY